MGSRKKEKKKNPEFYSTEEGPGVLTKRCLERKVSRVEKQWTFPFCGGKAGRGDVREDRRCSRERHVSVDKG